MAQCPGSLRARLWLLPGLDPAGARDAELGLRAVFCAEKTLVPEGEPIVAVEPSELLLSALKPREDGRGIVLRVLNPTEHALEGQVTLGFAFDRVEAIRLDEEPSRDTVRREGSTLCLSVPPHALQTLSIS